MEEQAIEKAISEREEWDSGSLGKSAEYLKFISAEPQKRTVFNFLFKIEKSKASMVINDSVKQRLLERNINLVEVGECFDNRNTQFAFDSRETETENQTLWFIAETNKSRKLKVILFLNSDKYILVNAYEPSEEENKIYSKAPAK